MPPFRKNMFNKSDLRKNTWYYQLQNSDKAEKNDKKILRILTLTKIKDNKLNNMNNQNSVQEEHFVF